MEKYKKEMLLIWFEPEVDSFLYNDANDLLKKHFNKNNKKNKILYLVYTKIFNNKKNDLKISFVASIKEVLIASKNIKKYLYIHYKLQSNR